MLNFFKKKKKDPEQENRAKMFLNAGIEYLKKKDYASSKKYFERVLEIDTGNEEAENYLQVALNKLALEEKRKQKQLLEEVSTDSDRHSPLQSKANNSPSAQNQGDSDRESVSGVKDRLYYFKALRLDSKAAPEDIKDAIALEFKKWRTRVNSPDINKRYEAEEMLNLISQAKRVLLPE